MITIYLCINCAQLKMVLKYVADLKNLYIGGRLIVAKNLFILVKKERRK